MRSANTKQTEKSNTRSPAVNVPIIAAFFIIIAALSYAGYKVYTLVATQFGAIWGFSAVLLAAAVLIYLVFFWFQRDQRLHGKSINKKRVLHQTLSNGVIELEPNHKSGLLQTTDYNLHFIFADIQQVMQQDQTLLLQLRDVERPIELVFDQANTAKLWLKRLQLATQQKL